MLSEYVLYCVYLGSHSVHIYAAHDDAAGSSLAPDKVASTTDDVRSKYGARDISTGTFDVPYPTAGTSTNRKCERIVLWKVFFDVGYISGFNCGGLHISCCSQ